MKVCCSRQRNYRRDRWFIHLKNGRIVRGTSRSWGSERVDNSDLEDTKAKRIRLHVSLSDYNISPALKSEIWARVKQDEYANNDLQRVIGRAIVGVVRLVQIREGPWVGSLVDARGSDMLHIERSHRKLIGPVTQCILVMPVVECRNRVESIWCQKYIKTPINALFILFVKPLDKRYGVDALEQGEMHWATLARDRNEVRHCWCSLKH